MKKFIIGVLLGIIIGAGGLWYLQQRQAGTLERSKEQTVADARKLMNAKLEALELQADKIQKELTESGRVVRRKAVEMGENVADAAADAKLTTAIKARLLADPHLSAWEISVSTTGGVVTLAGTVSSPELIGRAMLVALQTDGVNQVISTLQVK